MYPCWEGGGQCQKVGAGRGSSEEPLGSVVAEGVSGGRGGRDSPELFQEIVDAFLGDGRAVHLGDDKELLGGAEVGCVVG